MLHDADLTSENAAQRLQTHPVASERVRAALELDRQCDPAHAGMLLVAIHDGDWHVRSTAGWALVHLGPAVRPLVESVSRNSLDPDAREMADLILERIEDPLLGEDGA